MRRRETSYRYARRSGRGWRCDRVVVGPGPRSDGPPEPDQSLTMRSRGHFGSSARATPQQSRQAQHPEKGPTGCARTAGRQLAASRRFRVARARRRARPRAARVICAALRDASCHGRHATAATVGGPERRGVPGPDARVIRGHARRRPWGRRLARGRRRSASIAQDCGANAHVVCNRGRRHAGPRVGAIRVRRARDRVGLAVRRGRRDAHARRGRAGIHARRRHRSGVDRLRWLGR